MAGFSSSDIATALGSLTDIKQQYTKNDATFGNSYQYIEDVMCLVTNILHFISTGFNF